MLPALYNMTSIAQVVAPNTQDEPCKFPIHSRKQPDRGRLTWVQCNLQTNTFTNFLLHSKVGQTDQCLCSFYIVLPAIYHFSSYLYNFNSLIGSPLMLILSCTFFFLFSPFSLPSQNIFRRAETSSLWNIPDNHTNRETCIRWLPPSCPNTPTFILITNLKSLSYTLPKIDAPIKNVHFF